ncbi:hypothetical protein DL89DRAFT_309610 [Linderina pennispora]|uniref:Uncharacterized protein n=1 Tax=Linderina pennispora TaxID=61395 RepID=A0A1Y1WJG3_9FUNG|nr:uncharacterized protein DL89DRAFT_309610 [Linderina pennispora]ORX73366.1 hypothetical protein DL89DRAFT_309610 [Linderina pennispora]
MATNLPQPIARWGDEALTDKQHRATPYPGLGLPGLYASTLILNINVLYLAARFHPILLLLRGVFTVLQYFTAPENTSGELREVACLNVMDMADYTRCCPFRYAPLDPMPGTCAGFRCVAEQKVVTGLPLQTQRLQH